MGPGPESPRAAVPNPIPAFGHRPLMGPMSAGMALAGTAAVWLLVLIAATAGGYGTVQAWARWGARVGGPAWLQRALSLALGPSAVAATTGPATARPEPVPASAEAPPAPLRTVVPVAVAAEGPAPAVTEEDDTTAVDEAADAPAPRLGREDATAELGALLEADYSEVVVLLEKGLWGLDQIDAWARTMRGKPVPDGVTEDTWTRATHASWSALGERVLALRERRRTLNALETLWGVGPDEAEALYDAGYRDVAALQKVATDTLAKVPGIGMARAFQIRAAAHGLAPTA